MYLNKVFFKFLGIFIILLYLFFFKFGNIYDLDEN